MTGVNGVESVGIVRKMSPGGKFTLPKSLRQRFKIEQGDCLEITVDGDNLILSKYRPRCAFCGSTEYATDYKDKNVCQECMSSLKGKSR